VTDTQQLFDEDEGNGAGFAGGTQYHQTQQPHPSGAQSGFLNMPLLFMSWPRLQLPLLPLLLLLQLLFLQLFVRF
jgi:hypothetical protein